MKYIPTIFLLVMHFFLYSQSATKPLELTRCDSSDLPKITKAYESIKFLYTQNETGCIPDTKARTQMCEDCLIISNEDGSIYRGPCYVGGKSSELLIGRYDRTDKLKDVHGKILYKDGTFFIGEFSGGKPKKGLLIDGEDRYYDGELKENKPHGKGKLIQNGISYEGTWDEGAEANISQKQIIVKRRRSAEPNCVCGKFLLTELETVLNQTNLHSVLTKNDYDPTLGDFSVIFPDPMPDFYGSYLTRFKEHVKNNTNNFKQYSKRPISIECFTLETLVANHRNRLPKINKGFIQEKDCILKAIYFKKETLETYEVFFYKFKNGFKIIQFQLFYD